MSVAQRALTVGIVLACVACHSGQDSGLYPGSVVPSGTPATIPVPTSAPNVSGQPAGGHTSDFWVNMVSPPNTTMLLHKDGDWTAPCDLDPSVPFQDQACILEAEELDLYLQAFSLQYNFPGSPTCNYARILPYYYYKFAPGYGPTSVSVSVNANGAASITGQAGGTVTASIVNNTVTCGADYSSLSSGTVTAPNCCDGKYTLTTTTTPPGGGPATVTTTSAAWGGALSNCLVGPAMDISGFAKDRYGYPEYSVTPLSAAGLQASFPVSSPYSKGFLTNAYISNYFSVAPSSSNPYPLASAPTPIQGPAPGTIRSTNPWYEFVCMDHSEDVIQRIRVMVRTWSSHTEILKQAAGNPTAGGAEANYPDQPVLDRPSWPGAGGFGNSYPRFAN